MDCWEHAGNARFKVSTLTWLPPLTQTFASLWSLTSVLYPHFSQRLIRKGLLLNVKNWEDWAPLKATQYVNHANMRVQTVFNMCLYSWCWRDDNFKSEWTALKSCVCPVLYPRHWLSNAELLVLFAFYHFSPTLISSFVSCSPSLRPDCTLMSVRATASHTAGVLWNGNGRCWHNMKHTQRLVPSWECLFAPTKMHCGPTAQRVQKQHSELEVMLLLYFVVIPQKYQFISLFRPRTILPVYIPRKARLMSPNHTQSYHATKSSTWLKKMWSIESVQQTFDLSKVKSH